MCVDDLISGAENETKAFDAYQGSKKIFGDESFNLRKWHYNSSELMERISNRSLQKIRLRNRKTKQAANQS